MQKMGCYVCISQEMKMYTTCMGSSDVKNYSLKEIFMKGKERVELRDELTLS